MTASQWGRDGAPVPDLGAPEIRDIAARALWNPAHVLPAEVQAMACALLDHLRRADDARAAGDGDASSPGRDGSASGARDGG